MFIHLDSIDDLVSRNPSLRQRVGNRHNLSTQLVFLQKIYFCRAADQDVKNLGNRACTVNRLPSTQRRKHSCPEAMQHKKHYRTLTNGPPEAPSTVPGLSGFWLWVSVADATTVTPRRLGRSAWAAGPPGDLVMMGITDFRGPRTRKRTPRYRGSDRSQRPSLIWSPGSLVDQTFRPHLRSEAAVVTEASAVTMRAWNTQ